MLFAFYIIVKPFSTFHSVVVEYDLHFLRDRKHFQTFSLMRFCHLLFQNPFSYLLLLQRKRSFVNSQKDELVYFSFSFGLFPLSNFLFGGKPDTERYFWQTHPHTKKTIFVKFEKMLRSSIFLAWLLSDMLKCQ